RCGGPYDGGDWRADHSNAADPGGAAILSSGGGGLAVEPGGRWREPPMEAAAALPSVAASSLIGSAYRKGRASLSHDDPTRITAGQFHCALRRDRLQVHILQDRLEA